jgi:hypothetical protein
MPMPIFEGWKFLPLLSTRDVLIVLEILSFGLRSSDRSPGPLTVIYHNDQHVCDAFSFRKAILFQFSYQTFSDIVKLLQQKKEIINIVLDEIARRLASNFYDSQQINQGFQWLHAAILIECVTLNSWHSSFLPNVVWNEVEIMHWRLYFAKMLIEYA